MEGARGVKNILLLLPSMISGCIKDTCLESPRRVMHITRPGVGIVKITIDENETFSNKWKR